MWLVQLNPHSALRGTDNNSYCYRPYRIVRAAGHNEGVTILQTGNATLVPVERSHKLARRHVPDFDGAIARRRHDVAPVKVDDVDGGTVSDEHTTKADIRRRVHVPDSHRPILSTER